MTDTAVHLYIHISINKQWEYEFYDTKVPISTYKKKKTNVPISNICHEKLKLQKFSPSIAFLLYAIKLQLEFKMFVRSYSNNGSSRDESSKKQTIDLFWNNFYKFIDKNNSSYKNSNISQYQNEVIKLLSENNKKEYISDFFIKELFALRNFMFIRISLGNDKKYL